VRGKLFAFAAVACSCFAASAAVSLRGKLVEPPAIEKPDGQRVALEGDPETMSVLDDARLAGFELELLGEYKSPTRFAVGPFYTARSMFVLKDGKKYTVSYWRPVCSIRTHTPGKCMCCQRETHLDLVEEK